MAALNDAGGRSLGKKVAEKPNTPLYDKEVLLLVAAEIGLNQQFLKQIEETTSLRKSGGVYTTGGYPTSNIFLANRSSRAEDVAYKA